jgi:hypothetical protein
MVLAGHDYDRALQILDWPVRAGLEAFMARLRDEAAVEFRHSTLVWALLAPHRKSKSKPPALPEILKDSHGDT